MPRRSRPVRALRRWGSAVRRWGGRPVVVYTVGKTASTSLEQALRRALPRRPVHKVHWLTPQGLAGELAEHGRAPRHVRAARALLRTPPAPDRPWDVISIVRDPLAQAVSAFFQTAGRRGIDVGTVERANASFLADRARVRRNLAWFDVEVAPVLGIDVYEHPFDHGRRCLRADTAAVRLLVLRQEDLDGPQPLAAVGELFGVSIPPLPPANVGTAKDYGGVYRMFQSEAALPADLLDEVYGSRLARHFYTQEELRRFRSRWMTAS